MKIFFKSIVFILMVSANSALNAQCAMCKATAESSKDVGGGLNAGIEYIMFVPYLLLGLFAVFIFKGKLIIFWKDLIGKEKGEKKEYTAKEWY